MWSHYHRGGIQIQESLSDLCPLRKTRGPMTEPWGIPVYRLRRSGGTSKETEGVSSGNGEKAKLKQTM